MQKWDYLVLHWDAETTFFGAEGADGFEASLRVLGGEGWEMVQMIDHDDAVTVAFKRPLE
ncbi:MAG: hypothetical protein JF603_13720 [Acidobacteria bacterium]|nr:hypothetical protein [Acidobacteriota bacterium]